MLKNRFLLCLAFFVVIICMTACIKFPDCYLNNKQNIVNVVYRFEGGRDMAKLFTYEVTYVGDNGKKISENITSLPWTKSVVASLPFQASCNIRFTATSSLCDCPTYDIGFKNTISYTTSSGQSGSSTRSVHTKQSNDRDKLRFKVILPEGVLAENVNLSIAPLKYNKHFAFTVTTDDALVTAYSRLWKRIHAKWLDEEVNFHKGMEPTTGSMPQYTLSSTDGCGYDVRFAFGVSIFPTCTNVYHPNGFIKDQDNSKYNPYICWNELANILDFGGSVYYHNINNTKYSEMILSEIMEGLEKDYNKVLEKLNRKMKVLCVPDGIDLYVEAAIESPYCEFIRSSTRWESLIYINTCDDLINKYTYGGTHGYIERNGSTDFSEKFREIATQHKKISPYWLGITSHEINHDWLAMLETFYANYGKGGDDSAWVASWDEVYEYVSMRNNATITKEEQDGSLIFTITVPKHDNFYYRQLSFLMSGINANCIITPLDETIVGLKSAQNGTNILVNVDFEPQTLKLAEKYTELFENQQSDETRKDAVYFIEKRTEPLASSFKTRIAQIEQDPVTIISTSIDSDKNEVYTNDIILNIMTVGDPKMFRVGESEDLKDVKWQPFVSHEINYTLSNFPGKKIVYVQVKSEHKISNISSASVILREIPTSGEVSQIAAKAYQKMYNNYISTSSIKIEISK